MNKSRKHNWYSSNTFTTVEGGPPLVLHRVGPWTFCGITTSKVVPQRDLKLRPGSRSSHTQVLGPTPTMVWTPCEHDHHCLYNTMHNAQCGSDMRIILCLMHSQKYHPSHWLTCRATVRRRGTPSKACAQRIHTWYTAFSAHMHHHCKTHSYGSFGVVGCLPHSNTPRASALRVINTALWPNTNQQHRKLGRCYCLQFGPAQNTCTVKATFCNAFSDSFRVF